MTALLSRFALGGCLLALAAATVVFTGASGLGGSLGSLFGYQASLKPPPEAAAALVAPVPSGGGIGAAGAVLGVAQSGGSAVHRRARRPLHHARPRSEQPAPVQAAPQAPAPAPAPQPVVPPPPPPAPQGNVEKAAQTVQQAVAPVAPLQQPAAQVVQTITQVCGTLGGCP